MSTRSCTSFVVSELSKTLRQFVLVAVEGLLKGYDQLLNLVLDETQEYLKGSIDASKRQGRCIPLEVSFSTFSDR